ncbi:hypothetical protein [Spirillospora sp. NPDC048819]|uniref:hypothetical protein n=1 Tax=Spirillospora sp. NPDC048819 TaxID=3155268 RepID=UPI00340747FA
MKTTALEVRIRPTDGHIELRRLTTTLDQLRLALTDIDRAYIVRASRPKWVVARLGYQKYDLVVRVTATGTSKRPAQSMLASVDALVSGVESLKEEPVVPDYYSERTVERLLDISEPGHGIDNLSLATVNGDTGELVPVSDPVRQNARRAVVGTHETLGSVSGWLDSMNARRLGRHGLRVGLYDPLRKRAVTGEISADMADEAHDKFWRRRVLASGRILRNERGQAVRIKIDNLELLPEDDLRRASVNDVLGADDDWLGGQAVDDYIREARRA